MAKRDTVPGEGWGGEGADLEQLIKRHEEYHVQIDMQLNKSQAVKDEGKYLVDEGNFMGQEIAAQYFTFRHNVKAT